MAYVFAFIPLVLIISVYLLLGMVWRRVFEKMGYAPGWGVVMLLPLANIAVLIALAFSQWPAQKVTVKRKEGRVFRKPAPLPLPAMLIVIAAGSIPFAVLLAAVSIPNVMRTRMALQEQYAQESVEVIGEAIETYAAVNHRYPQDERELTEAAPPYLARSYQQREIRGYTYMFTFWPDGYRVVAEPSRCDVSGRKVFTLTPGGNIREEECP